MNKSRTGTRVASKNVAVRKSAATFFDDKMFEKYTLCSQNVEERESFIPDTADLLSKMEKQKARHQAIPTRL